MFLRCPSPAGKVPGVGGEAVFGLGVCDLCAAELRSCALHPHRGRLQTHPTANALADRQPLPQPLQQPGLRPRRPDRHLQSALEDHHSLQTDS